MAVASIERFEGAHRFLSNFYPARVELDGLTFPSVEHAYQAAKAESLAVRARFSVAPPPFWGGRVLTAGQAKRAGRKIDLRAGWDGIKVEVMAQLLRQKFAQEPLRGMLLATGETLLVETNWWHDTFWGVCNGEGQNWLGRLLMAVRTELQTAAAEQEQVGQYGSVASIYKRGM